MPKTLRKLPSARLENEMEYDESICCMEAEQDLIWTKEYLYKREYFPKKSDIEFKPEDFGGGMFEGIPF